MRLNLGDPHLHHFKNLIVVGQLFRVVRMEKHEQKRHFDIGERLSRFKPGREALEGPLDVAL